MEPATAVPSRGPRRRAPGRPAVRRCRPRPGRARRRRVPRRAGRDHRRCHGRHPAADGARLRRAAHPPPVRPHHVPQRRGLRRAGPRPWHPGTVGVRAPHAALRRRRPRRLPARPADPRAVEARPRGRAVRPPSAGAGAAHHAGRRLAADPSAPARRRRRRRGRAHVHDAARCPGRGHHHDHLELRGALREDPRSRAEFLALTDRGHRRGPMPAPDRKDDTCRARTFAVVGAGLAGGKTAEALRAEGFDGRIVLFGAEPHLPYERPPLSKGYLQGNDERESVFVHPEDWYAEHDVDLRLGRAGHRPGPARARADDPRRRRRCTTTGCCSPPARRRAGCGCPARTCRACTTCARSTTATRCAPRSGPGRTWW